MFRPAGWNDAPVLRVTRGNTVSSALWDIAVLVQSSELSAPVSRATATDTAMPATLRQVTPLTDCLPTAYRLLTTAYLTVAPPETLAT